MSVTHYRSVESLLAGVDTFLKQREDTNNFVYGTLAMTPFGTAKPIPSDFLAAIQHGDEVSLVAAQRTSMRLALSGDDGTVTDDDLLDLARSYVTWHLGWERQLNPCQGPADITTRFAKAVAQAAQEQGLDVEAKNDFTIRQYALHKIIPANVPPTGTLRVATDDDLDLLADWFGGFFRDSGIPMPSDLDSDYYRQLAHRGTSRGLVYLYEVSLDGGKPQPVSMAAKIRPYLQCTAISNVYTPVPFRQRGYAGACMRAVCKRLREVEEFQSIVLFADEKNAVTGPMYMRMGFVDNGLHIDYAFVAKETSASP